MIFLFRIFNSYRLTDEFIDESIAATNTHFGGLNPGIYRVIMTHGEMDPRSALGPNEDINANSPVIVMSRKLIINFNDYSCK